MTRRPTRLLLAALALALPASALWSAPAEAVPGKAPVAVDDQFSGVVGETLAIAAPGVLGNDYDLDSSTITIGTVSAASVGDLNLKTHGGFFYTPPVGFSGDVTFTYKAIDPTGLQSATATVTITIVAPNQAPVGVSDAYSTLGSLPLFVPVGSGLLANDTDPDGDALVVDDVDQPAHGTLSTSAWDGSFVYLAAAGFSGTDTFHYQAGDSQGAHTGWITVTITVVAPNLSPIGGPDAYSTVTGVPLVVPAGTGLLANDTDPNGDPMVVDGFMAAAHGTLSGGGAGDGGFTYTPAAGFVGTDTFHYQAGDPQGAHTGWVAVTVTVVPANQAPVATPDAYSTTSGVPLVVPVASGLLVNDADPDGDALLIDDLGQPGHGSVSVTAWDGGFTYTPVAGFVGTDTFTYRAGDPHGAHTGWITVTITVLAVDVPVIQGPTGTAATSPVPVALELGKVPAASGGATVPVTVHVTSSGGLGAGVPLVLSLGTSRFTGTTGPTGDVVIQVRLPERAGPYVLTGQAGAAVAQQTLTVGTPVTGRLTMPRTLHRGDRAVLRGRIGTTRARLAVTLIGPGARKHTYAARTSTRGRLVLRLPAGATAPAGRYRVLVSFVPDARHFAVEAWTRNFRSIR
jgi:uncharacterized protein YraI